MANDLVITGDTAQVPAHLQAKLAAKGATVKELGVSIPSISILGKVFTVNLGGERIKLISRNSDGDEVPLAVLPIVILAYNSERGRAYYATKYDPANPKQPDCWSRNSVEPDSSVAKPVSKQCQGCTNSIKGSAKTDAGDATVACGSYRLIAVMPVAKLGKDMPPLRMRLSQTSDYDGRSKDAMTKGQYAFSNYMSALKARGINNVEAISTKLQFDLSSPHPKLFFKTDRWLDEAEYAAVEKIDMTLIAKCLDDDPGPSALSDEDEPGTADTETPGKSPRGRKPKAEKEAKTEPQVPAEEKEEEDPDDKVIREAQERKAAKQAAKKDDASKGNGAATMDMDSPTKPTEATPAGEMPAAVKDMLNEWG